MVSLGKYMSLQAQVPTTASRLTEILVICSWDQSSSPGNKNSNKTYLVWEGTVLDLLLPSTVRLELLTRSLPHSFECYCLQYLEQARHTVNILVSHDHIKPIESSRFFAPGCPRFFAWNGSVRGNHHMKPSPCYMIS